MPQPECLECVRCEREYPLDAHDRQCESCAANGVACNLTPRYPVMDPPTRDDLPATPNSLWRYADHLPILNQNIGNKEVIEIINRLDG